MFRFILVSMLDVMFGLWIIDILLFFFWVFMNRFCNLYYFGWRSRFCDYHWFFSLGDFHLLRFFCHNFPLYFMRILSSHDLL